jgi:hypothetical protein
LLFNDCVNSDMKSNGSKKEKREKEKNILGTLVTKLKSLNIL